MIIYFLIVHNFIHWLNIDIGLSKTKILSLSLFVIILRFMNLYNLVFIKSNNNKFIQNPQLVKLIHFLMRSDW